MRTSPWRPDLLAGRRAFVTGGTQGIGLVLARELALHGAAVTVASRKPENLDAARRELSQAGVRVEAVALDVRDREGVEAAAEAAFAHGNVDILVNNAAGNFAVPFLDMSPNAWDAVVNIVLQGTANVCRSFGQRWRERGSRASVVNMVVGYASTGAPWVSHSGAAKAGVLNLTRSLAVEWAPRGVRVNAVSPGFVADTGGERVLAAAPEVRQEVLARTPLGRTATREEIADAVLYLASDAASYVTGACVSVDGGLESNGWNLLAPGLRSP